MPSTHQRAPPHGFPTSSRTSLTAGAVGETERLKDKAEVDEVTTHD